MAAETREIRIHGSLLAAAEKRLLIWIARRLPRWISSDHLTALGALAMLGAGICYTVAPRWPGALLLAVLMLAINWFGDSLDGTVARVRHHERPRYGFYVDHVLDAIGILLLIAGLVAGGFMSLAPGAAFLLAYYLLTIEIALATHALGTFKISYWKFGPTELRILLAVGTLQLLRSPWSTIADHRLLLFDIGAAVGAIAVLLTFIVATIRNTTTLYRLEPLPDEGTVASRDRGDRSPGARLSPVTHATGTSSGRSLTASPAAPALSVRQ
jgi:archaetidylinositol phosphate synthase